MALDSVFDKPYDPAKSEEFWAQNWIDKGFFESSEDDPRPPYTVVIPPPNVTGDLHVGHVLNNTLQDLLVRYQRLKGKNVCWIPGTDHASIATEAKVTSFLASKGISKRDIGREAFLKEAYKWKDEYGGRILRRLKRIGASCAWSREVFTMDPDYSRAVLTAFVKLYKKGFVYRGQRLVNWCPVSQSVISDEEVISEERQGHLWHIAYTLVSPDGSPSGQSLTVATTRPETLFGDLAVAVHPDDERYRELVGRSVIVPVCGRVIPIIADSYVEKDFGTGVVKITPAHDMNDFEVGARHNLGHLNVMNPDASLNANVPPHYRGLDRYEARKKLVLELKEIGALIKTDNHKMTVGISERGNVPIEYYLSEQWYFKMQELATRALDATRSGKLTLYPPYTNKIWEHWLGGIQDWCVSRQLWWGHRIPIYTCASCGEVHCEVDKPSSCVACGHTKLNQDEDVLDTWASSWLWPFGVQGWPGEDAKTKKKMATYYPTELIITGQEIIFFWIARMVMAGQFFTGHVPFHTVYFTPIVRDAKGRKMSKSLGNSPDLGELTEKYGTDALRFAVVNQIVMGQDIPWKDESCEMGRHFANKLWNATRFLVSHAEKLGVDTARCTYESLQVPDDVLARWLLAEFAALVRHCEETLAKFHFAGYSSKIYEFFWMVFCDWFVELLKPKLSEQQPIQERQMLVEFALCVFDGALRVLHPVMPFVTEEIWHQLAPGKRENQTIGLNVWPGDLPSQYSGDDQAIESMRGVQAIVGSIRAIRGNYSLHPAESLRVILPEASRESLGKFVSQLEFLAKASVQFGGVTPRVVGVARAAGTEVFVDLDGHRDPAEESRSVKERLLRVEALLTGINKKLSNDSFVKSAPPEVVEGARSQKLENEAEAALLRRALEIMDK